MDIIDKKSATVLSFFAEMDSVLDCIKETMKNRTPHLNGEKFLTGNEVCKTLRISPRTLQEWRNRQVLPFIKLKGKILYKQSDIFRCLENQAVH